VERRRRETERERDIYKNFFNRKRKQLVREQTK
jgi:hypothetical protein